MDTKQMVKGLLAERKRIDKVIALLSGGKSSVVSRPGTGARVGKRQMSAAEKERRSKAAKERWAKRKKAEKAGD